METRFIGLALVTMVMFAGCVSEQPEGGGNASRNLSPAGFNPSSYGNPHPKIPVQNPPCCEHPYWLKVYRATSPDGLQWQEEGVLLRNETGVPEAIVLENGTTILYYVNGEYDTFDCSVSDDGKSFAYGNCTIYGFTEEKAWDPSVVKLDNGFYRLYFFSPGPYEENRIMSAISKDGINWLQEPGVRFSHTRITDPEVEKIGGFWRMYLYHSSKEEPEITDILLARSEDGLTFMEEAELNVSRGIVDITPLDSGGYAMYLDCVERAVSNDGLNWTDFRIVMKEEGGMRPCMPSVVRSKDGYTMYYQRNNISWG